MAKGVNKPCPFCGKRPTGRRFCSSERGPMLQCQGCGANGPPPLPEGESYFYSLPTERKLQKASVRMWNMPRVTS